MACERSLEPSFPFLGSRICRTVAGRAILWCGLVKQHDFRFDGSREFMTLGTTHVLVRSTQRELSPLLVIKQRWLPLHAVVAFGTTGHARLRELLPVDVCVAFFALGRRRFEVHINELGLEIWRFMAIDARRGAMRTKQWEFRLRMVEARQFFP